MSQRFRTVLLPGRHHVLTRFQADYLHALLAGEATDTEGEPVEVAEDAVVVWAVTSANHRGTRRNPVPAARREAAIERFALAEGIESLVVGVVDVAPTDRFAELTVKTVAHETGGRRTPTPADTVVACSTAAVTAMYRALGYRVVPVEAGHPADPARPWDVLELLVAGDESWRDLAHPATVSVLDRYGLVDAVRTICTDPVVGSDGGLTATREYRSYIAAFEAAADRKWAQARPWVRPGRIVDIGCATGAMLELAAAEPSLHESDLFGVEVARHLYDECEHRKAQGAFAANPNTFFVHANVLAGPVLPPGTVDTTTTFALTHEILSYGDGVPALERLAAEIARHTAPGGVWVNSDVCGPRRRRPPGPPPAPDGRRRPRTPRSTWPPCPTRRPTSRACPPAPGSTSSPSTSAAAPASRSPTRRTATTSCSPLADAMEFLTKRSYTDNWLSETHERFCALDGDAWARLVTAAGFEVDPRSGPWRNEWLVENVLARSRSCSTRSPGSSWTGPTRTSCSWPAPGERLGQGQRELQDRPRVLQAVAVELAQLAHPVPHGLRVHEQLGGHRVAPAVVQQPGAQRLGELLPRALRQVLQRGQRRGPQVGQGVLVGVQHQLAQPLLGVHRGAGPTPPSSATRTARRWEAATSHHGRGGPTTASRPSSARSRAARPDPSASGTSRTAGSSSPGCSVAGSSTAAAPRTRAPGTRTAVRVRGGVQPARSAAATSSSCGAPASSRRPSFSSSRARARPVACSSSACPETLAAESASM